METTLIVNGTIVTMDGHRRIIQDGAIAIEGNRIAEVGKTSDVQSKYRKDQVIDAKHHLVTPGLFDGHVHNSFNITKGLYDSNWLPPTPEFVFAYEYGLSEDEVRVGAQASMVELLKSGCTYMAEVGAYHNRMATVARAIDTVGIRGSFTRSLRNRTASPYRFIPESALESTEETLRGGEQLVKEWNGKANGRINGWFGIRYMVNLTDELLIKTKELADRYGVGIHCHASAEPTTDPESLKMTGYREVERLERIGVLDKNWMLIHMGHVNDQEVEYVKKRDAKVIHCPAASAKALLECVSGGQFIKMIEAGITIGLGTDSSIESNYVDMVRIAYQSVAAHLELFPTQKAINAHKVMEMLTVDGARANLQGDRLGSLEKGKLADIVLYDMRGMEWHPYLDPVTALIYSANGHSAQTVLVDGRVVMDNRKVLTLDEDKLREEVDTRAAEVRGRLGKAPEMQWPVV